MRTDYYRAAALEPEDIEIETFLSFFSKNNKNSVCCGEEFHTEEYKETTLYSKKEVAFFNDVMVDSLYIIIPIAQNTRLLIDCRLPIYLSKPCIMCVRNSVYIILTLTRVYITLRKSGI